MRAFRVFNDVESVHLRWKLLGVEVDTVALVVTFAALAPFVLLTGVLVNLTTNAWLVVPFVVLDVIAVLIAAFCNGLIFKACRPNLRAKTGYHLLRTALRTPIETNVSQGTPHE